MQCIHLCKHAEARTETDIHANAPRQTPTHKERQAMRVRPERDWREDCPKPISMRLGGND